MIELFRLSTLQMLCDQSCEVVTCVEIDSYGIVDQAFLETDARPVNSVMIIFVFLCWNNQPSTRSRNSPVNVCIIIRCYGH